MDIISVILTVRKKKLMDKEIYYPYLLNNVLYYQDDNNTDTAMEKNDNIGELVKINLTTKEKSVLYKGVSATAFAVKTKRGIKLIVWDVNCSYLSCYGDKLYYYDLDEEDRCVDRILTCNLDGMDKVELKQGER